MTTETLRPVNGRAHGDCETCEIADSFRRGVFIKPDLEDCIRCQFVGGNPAAMAVLKDIERFERRVESEIKSTTQSTEKALAAIRADPRFSKYFVG